MKKKIWKIALGVLAALVLVLGTLLVGELDQPASQVLQEEGSVYAPTVMNAKSAADTMEVSMDYGASADTMVRASGSARTAPALGGRKLVRTADLTIRTKTFEEAAAQVQTLLAQMGGYVEYSYQSGETGYRRLNLSMRVPSDQLDSFLSAMEGTGRVTDRSESTTDMTTQYQDNEARLATLYAKRERLNELLVQADMVSDLIEIESAIADTQYEIDVYETSQRTIDQQVDLSAVNVNLVEERAADTAAANVTLGERIRAAFAASIEWIGEFSQDLLVFLVVIAPVAVPVIIVILIVRFARKRKGK